MKNHTLMAIVFSLGLSGFALAQDTSLHMAVVEGDRAAVQNIIEAGANVNGRMNGGWTALMVSVKYGRLDIMNDLIRANANVNATDSKGNTALILAVTARRVSAVRSLLAFRADVTIKNNDGMDALEIASLIDEPDIIKLLNDYISQKG